MRWWGQKIIDWEKAKAQGAATESESESEADGEGEATGDADSRASGLSRGGMEWSECRRVGSKLVNILHKYRV